MILFYIQRDVLACAHSEGLVRLWKPPITWKWPKTLQYLDEETHVESLIHCFEKKCTIFKFAMRNTHSW